MRKGRVCISLGWSRVGKSRPRVLILGRDEVEVWIWILVCVTASAASPDKRRLEPVCQRINEPWAHACVRWRGGENLSWILWAVADSQCSRRSRRYDVYN